MPLPLHDVPVKTLLGAIQSHTMRMLYLDPRGYREPSTLTPQS